MVSPSELYLDLMKKVLVNWIYLDRERDYLRAVEPSKVSWLKRMKKKRKGTWLAGLGDPEKRRTGADWPPFAHSMVGLARLDNLQRCVETVIRENIPGDFLEAGVWRGGASILVRAVCAAHGVTNRTVWVCDSFEGLPPPDPDKYPADAGDTHHTHRELAISLEEVRKNFELYGLLDERVKFVKGWFKDTLPGLPARELAVVRLDGDMYESTMDGLTHLYPRLSRGGFLVIDDYGAVPACRKAVEDYRAQHHITDPIEPVDWTGAFWRKGR